MRDKPRIAYTLGEPAGIGPDLAVRMALWPMDCRLVAIGDPELLRQRANALGLAVEMDVWREQSSASGHLSVLTEELVQPVVAGRLDRANAGYVLQCLNRAIDGCMEGEFDAMVTGPVHKGIINDAGIEFTGHTEYIAGRTGSEWPVMMLATKTLRVALVTTHVPLCKVSAMITRERIDKIIEVVFNALQRQFGIDQPRIAVCGLNPHAGEHGYLGHEEDEVIIPVIRKYQQSGLAISGPLPADTVFIKQNVDRFDAVLTMYHDQGLPVVKQQGFSEAVNVTLGIPIIRTSVDHGTALDLAGGADVDVGSSMAAVGLAIELAGRKTASR